MQIEPYINYNVPFPIILMSWRTHKTSRCEGLNTWWVPYNKCWKEHSSVASLTILSLYANILVFTDRENNRFLKK